MASVRAWRCSTDSALATAPAYRRHLDVAGPRRLGHGLASGQRVQQLEHLRIEAGRHELLLQRRGLTGQRGVRVAQGGHVAGLQPGPPPGRLLGDGHGQRRCLLAAHHGEGTDPQGATACLGVVGTAHDHESGAGHELTDRGDQAHPGQPGQTQPQPHHVGGGLDGIGQRRLAAVRLGHHLDVGAGLERHRELTSPDGPVVAHEHADAGIAPLARVGEHDQALCPRGETLLLSLISCGSSFSTARSSAPKPSAAATLHCTRWP